VGPLEVSFTDLSAGEVTDWYWTFGDGDTSTEQNPAHTYNEVGVYTVSLEVSGPAGTDSRVEADYITVNEPPVAPVADFSGTPLSGPAPHLVSFTDLSTGDVTGWLWAFGDGGTSTEQNPSHIYNDAGVYTVSLEVSGPAGTDSRIETDYVTVTPGPPVADFSASPQSGLAPLEVSFTDLSAGDVTGWYWTFGDGETSTDQHPTHVYADPGAYTVSLEVSGPGGTDSLLAADYITVTDPSAVLSVSIVDPSEYELDLLRLPPDYTRCYLDRNYAFLTAPERYVGLPFIRPANADMYDTSDEFLTFEVNKPVTVYVLYSVNAVTPPDWLTGRFTANGDQITRTYHTWNVWEADYEAGEIILGGNRAAGVETGGATVGMYVVVVEER